MSSMRLAAVAAALLSLPVSAGAKTSFAVVHPFGTDGSNLHAGVVLDAKGNLFGATVFGGPDNYGEAFELSPKGNFKQLHGFSGSDGVYPHDVIVDDSGNIYGSTTYGGANNEGEVYELSPKGKLSILHSFAGSDGRLPNGGLLLDAAGNLFGTTEQGGTNGNGTVFEIPAHGTYKVLSSFPVQNGVEAAYPEAAPIEDSMGNLYGTTQDGGAGGDGTVYKLKPDGTFTILHSFVGSDGKSLFCRLVQDSSGALYGTATYGGDYSGGVAFKIASSGKFSVLHSFGNGADGQYPSGGLAMTAGGILYGTTPHGGQNAFGVIYRIARGKETVVHDFAATDGEYSYAALTLGKKGNFYGTTSSGGPTGSDGTVFKFHP